MMGGMLVVVFCICYCCHKRVQKAELQTDSSEQWLHNTEDSDSMMQVFTLDGQVSLQQCALHIMLVFMMISEASLIC